MEIAHKFLGFALSTHAIAAAEISLTFDAVTCRNLRRATCV